IRAKVGERVRIWVVDAGPNRPSAFHIIGGQFDTVFKEGAYRLKRGNAEKGASQTLDLAASQGGFVELEFAEAVTTPSSTTRWSTPNAEPTASSRSPTEPVAVAVQATRSPCPRSAAPATRSPRLPGRIAASTVPSARGPAGACPHSG